MPDALMRMTTSSGPGTGSGRSRTSSLPPPRKRRAFMSVLLSRRRSGGVSDVARALTGSRPAPPGPGEAPGTQLRGTSQPHSPIDDIPQYGTLPTRGARAVKRSTRGSRDIPQWPTHPARRRGAHRSSPDAEDDVTSAPEFGRVDDAARSAPSPTATVQPPLRRGAGPPSGGTPDLPATR